MKRIAMFLSFGVSLSLFRSTAQPREIGQWEPFELSMSGSAEFANGYLDGLPDGGKPLVAVTFTGTSGDAKGLSYAVPGFWDGGKTWKVRFTPPAPGRWSYSAASNDPAFQGVRGSLQCTGCGPRATCRLSPAAGSSAAPVERCGTCRS